MWRNIGAVILVIGSIAFCGFLVRSSLPTPEPKPVTISNDDAPASAPSDTIHYDPKAAVFRQEFEIQNADASACFEKYHRIMLREGVRSHKELIAGSLQQCSVGIGRFMVGMLGRPPNEVSAYLNALSEQELNQVLAEDK